VERVVEYLELPQEPPSTIEGKVVPVDWPSATASTTRTGEANTAISLNDNQNCFIKVSDLVIRYSPELPSVLHNVSFGLKFGEKVGLLGRTGSGKSTLGGF
jgi:ABC-type multidrug transport system fused ATPase/permease subunit